MIYITSPYSTDPIAVTLTADIYWAHQPLPVQALRYADPGVRFAMAQELAKQGYAIDMEIMVWGWDPVTVMALRESAGYTWFPRADQPRIPIGPGITNPWGLPAYDPNNPPAGSILVSVDASKYPPVMVVPTAPVQPSKKIVGSLVNAFTGEYGPGPGAMINSMTPAVSDGQEVSQDGAIYIAHLIQEPMGIYVGFKLKSATLAAPVASAPAPNVVQMTPNPLAASV